MNKTAAQLIARAEAKHTKDAKEFIADLCLPWRTGGLAARGLAVQFVKCY
jgi:hypothetical protein